MAEQPRPLIGLAAGIAAGLIAAAALAAAAEAAREADAADDGAEPGTLPVPATAAAPRSNRTRFIAGAVLGGIYGLIAEFRPDARDGFGGTYRIATGALIEEEAPPEDDDPAPALFTAILDGIRTLLAGRR